MKAQNKKNYHHSIFKHLPLILVYLAKQQIISTQKLSLQRYLNNIPGSQPAFNDKTSKIKNKNQ